MDAFFLLKLKYCNKIETLSQHYQISYITILKMNSKQMQIYNNKSRYEKHNWDPLLNVLTNAEYLTFTAEPSYAFVTMFAMTLSQDILRHILKYTQCRNYLSELSTRTVRRLETSIAEGNFEQFRFIYDTEYMQSNIFNWFEYDRAPSNSSGWKFYLNCTCIKNEPIKIHHRLYIQQCKCKKGKQYLAFKIAVDGEYKKEENHRKIENYILEGV